MPVTTFNQYFMEVPVIPGVSRPIFLVFHFSFNLKLAELKNAWKTGSFLRFLRLASNA